MPSQWYFSVKQLVGHLQKKFMRNTLTKLTLLCALVTVLGLNSCKKDKSSSETTTQLIKTTFWNPSTGVESTYLEFAYDNAGVITAAKGANADTYSVEYDAQGKLSKVNKTNPNGRATIYQLEYNASGRVVKVVQINTSGGATTGSASASYDYNSAGKIVKVINTYPGSSSTIEYFWLGDNIAEAKTTNSSGTYLAVAKYVYDDKLNPYSLGGNVMAFIFYGTPASKNNIVEISTAIGTTLTSQKRSYEYNALGYATSMKLLDGSNEGQKYYYK